MSLLTRRRWLIPLAIVVLLAVAGGVLVESNFAAVQAQRTYQGHRHALDADLKAAQGQGYTAEDLGPITSRLAQIDSGPAPWWLTSRADFYRHQDQQVVQLDADLNARQKQLLEQAEGDTTQQVAAARTGIDRDRDLGADDSDLKPLQQRLEGVAKVQGAAHTITDFRNASKQAQALASDVTAVGTAQQAENQAIAAAAEDLKGQTGGNLDAIRKAGADALYSGRNDASIAAYLNKSAPFKSFDVLSKAYSRLEKYGQKLDSGDVNQVALGTGALKRYGAQVHDALMGNLPARTIVLSQTAQQLWAFEGGNQVMTTVVTTGKPPDLITDLGPMKVLSKSSPWKMHSPWPKGSPYWYPDTEVQMVLWFTNTGEGLHDASWQPCCWGPGSQYSSYASHGCVHVPVDQERFLFNWAPVGTPVVHYPGDGQPVDKQLAQITTDDQGNPTTGPKGA
jgi:hypothetical protein